MEIPPRKMADDLFVRVDKSSLISSRGATYAEIRKSLAARWGLVWRDIALGWVGLAVVMAAVIGASRISVPVAIFAALAGAVLVGFGIAYLMLFQHEAAHYNLHRDRKTNDWICNLFCCGIVGLDIQSYRLIHWDHHRHFGGPMDTEITYRDPLNVRFIVEALLGIRALRVVLLRGRKLQTAEPVKHANPNAKARLFALAGGAAFNLFIVSTLFYFGQWAAMFSWVCGVLVFFPFFGALRQLLEHREELTDLAAQRAEVVSFATNRLFGDGLLSSSFGGAGFNRHLLHHWDPQISYTRLRDLETFLLDTTVAAPYLLERQTTYWRTFGRLFSVSR